MRIRYENLDGVENNHSYKAMSQWRKERRSKVKDLTIQIPQSEEKEIEVLQNNREKASITWIGHSTFLIQLDGLNILTDPVWAKWQGTDRRLTNPGIAIEELPEIDIVVISHGHYDHLDFGSIRRLKGNPTYYVPHGLKRLFVKKGYSKTIEANWWDSFDNQNLKITFVPAQHWTRRSLFDTNSSHWGGWMLEEVPSGQSIYFVGDTGYFRGFKEMAERFHSINYVLMPIGAYEPEWFMKISHINPEDAVKAFRELKATTFIPMHYGAYRLADDTGPEALGRLFSEWERLNLSKGQLCVLNIGGTLWLDAD
ncbi:MBL fold metallo-hydrolase [Cytobacillus sp. FJAT-53684]|uniref:MBL fold metallo-hydrolase n=1 Tax=Cytobacillus mangrovibacter TaxID=3299024 RepID=A0ABW6JVM4_9BACI